MIKHLKNYEIDKSRWDETIENSPNGNIYAYSWYLDIVCKNWEALVDENYTSVMPITCGYKYFKHYIYPPYFAQQLGIFSRNQTNEKLCKMFLEAIPSKFNFIEMNLNSSDQWVPEHFQVKQNKNFVLEMGKSYDEIRSGYSENHLRNIKKASKNKLSIFKNGDPLDIIQMFRKNRGKFVENLETKHYELFANLVATTSIKKRAKVWILNNSYGLPIAGAVFFESHQTGIFIFSAVTNEGKTLSAMHYLIDAFISEHAETLKRLDFEGSNDPDLARFYKGFGSTEFVYLQIKNNQLPAPWKWFKK